MNRVLIIDDDKDLVFSLSLFLEQHNFKVFSANNGKKGLEVLKNLEKSPDVIISDIKMPGMDGFQFFNEITTNLEWQNIPFIFLTAINEAEKIREGKKIGVSDILTKPFSERELLATIKGKIERQKRMFQLDDQLSKLLDESQPKDLTKNKRNHLLEQKAYLFLIDWDDILGPKIEKLFPEKSKKLPSLETIARNLFQTSVLIYGQDNISKPEDILLNLSWLNSKAYLFFDSISEEKFRSKQKQFMLCFLCPKISYIDSLKIKPIIHEMAKKYKRGEKINFKNYFKKIIEALSLKTPFIDI